ncbi:OmpH family outer membrane protein [Hymenobacter psychrophilus]|uniref:Periplasmic chaperone for outer membrane proteins Skp n=1 Tax=Hymenobacter psychrophilus TaxID=651662 RepID=A0A1H3MN71_9BACT|nr:OmpH family outer membrane protein [Hymenobacter psychrophilus]SDY77539.1 periplasmic chaperone for outer membrane proteins Skp [Hymenobacter psychrophilus]
MNQFVFRIAAILALLLVMLGAPAAQAQKFGYVDSEFILGKMPAYVQAQQELNTLAANWQKDLENQKAELDKLHRNYQAEEVVLTETMKKKRQDEILAKEQEIKTNTNKIFGYEGQLFRKRQELTKPVQDIVFESIEKVAKKKQLAIVFDKSGDLTMLYTNPVHDYTEFVLEELGLASPEANQPGQKGPVKTVTPPSTPAGDVPPAETDEPAPRRPAARPASRKK